MQKCIPLDIRNLFQSFFAIPNPTVLFEIFLHTCLHSLFFYIRPFQINRWLQSPNWPNISRFSNVFSEFLYVHRVWLHPTHIYVYSTPYVVCTYCKICWFSLKIHVQCVVLEHRLVHAAGDITFVQLSSESMLPGLTLYIKHLVMLITQAVKACSCWKISLWWWQLLHANGTVQSWKDVDVHEPGGLTLQFGCWFIKFRIQVVISEPPAMKKRKNEQCVFDVMVATASRRDCPPSTQSAVTLSVCRYLSCWIYWCKPHFHGT